MQLYSEILYLRKQKIRKIRDRWLVISYTLLIYITLPVSPRLWERFTGYAGNFADYVTAVILGLAGLLIVFYLISKRKSIRAFIWLATIASAYAWGLKNLDLSIERIHFIEYGLLAVLVFRALRHHIRDKSIYLCSGFAVFWLGFLDEGIQYILPNRVFELKDVIVNGAAGALGVLLIAFCFQPELGLQNAQKNR